MPVKLPRCKLRIDTAVCLYRSDGAHESAPMGRICDTPRGSGVAGVVVARNARDRSCPPEHSKTFPAPPRWAATVPFDRFPTPRANNVHGLESRSCRNGLVSLGTTHTTCPPHNGHSAPRPPAVCARLLGAAHTWGRSWQQPWVCARAFGVHPGSWQTCHKSAPTSFELVEMPHGGYLPRMAGNPQN